jgi:myo-inositol-1(or 4)-monophosphatase
VRPAESAARHERSSSELAELLGVALESARMAGALLLERFEGGIAKDVRSKSTPTDLVSEADFASQRAIRASLAELRPHDGFLGEEESDGSGPDAGDSRDADRSVRERSAASEGEGLRWVVDPLDGTVNFLFGIPQWCVSVAVQDETGASLAGAIFDPCRDEMWAATSDGGATLNGTAVESSRRTELSTAMVATGLYYAADVRTEQARILASLVSRVRDIRRLGSAALDLAWTAAGRYDAYFERGVKLWDVAAGTLICERAGLRVVDLAEVPGATPLPRGILVASPGIVNSLLELVG